jgi:hypothetical protein
VKVRYFFVTLGSFFLCLSSNILLGMQSSITTEELRSVLKDSIRQSLTSWEMGNIVQQIPRGINAQEFRTILRETIPNQMHHTHALPVSDIESAARRLKTVVLEGLEEYEADHGNEGSREAARQRIAQRREEEQRRLEAEERRSRAETERLNAESRLQQEKGQVERAAFKREALDKLSKAGIVALFIGLIYLGYRNHYKNTSSTQLNGVTV